jgi:hypothetical protein
MNIVRVGRLYINARHLSAVRMTPEGRAEVGFRDMHTVVLDGADAAALRAYLDRHSTDLSPRPPQPRPMLWRVGHRRAGGGWVTAISRFWGSIDPAHCRLCPRGRCNYDDLDGSCLVVVGGYVRQEDAELHPAGRDGR